MSKLADPSEDDETMIPPFLGYSKQGSATGALLYVNYGRTEDFDVLKKNFSISNCSGYIAIMRYGKIFRGDKVFIYFLSWAACSKKWFIHRSKLLTVASS
jgi:hypothetical protein